jgi:type IV secretory pathway VirB10-like protein
LSSRKQEKEGVNLANPFREVGEDLRHLTGVAEHAVSDTSEHAQSSVPDRAASSMEYAPRAQPEPPRKQGRPAIPMEIKRQALEAKQKPGNTNKDVAKIIYGTARPTLRQVKNVTTILRYYQNHQG